MTANEAVVRIVYDLLNAERPPGHEIAGFVGVLVTVPKGGGKAEITVQFSIHESILHHHSDMLRDVADAVNQEAHQLEPKEIH